MVRRLLGSQMQPLNDIQRENIFHTKCTINGKLCSLIIDGGSCTNVASSKLVSKLNLDTQLRPRPYRLQWLSEDEEVKVCKKPGEEGARDIYTGEMCKKPGEEGARDIYTGEGWFKMLSLSRSFTVADNSGMKSRTGGLSVSLAGPDGWVIGGGVVGLLTVVLSDSETVQVLYLL
ncbi:uncharacterized protein [Glycine max]|uniref:uncharacterized protein n=1 Tax=Glycine max TaxID=3847 RepID=UPI001B357D47|nr:uncharacterized protein LOC102659869 [Glycine max]